MMKVMAEESAELVVRDAASDDVATVARLWEELGHSLSQGHVADQLRVHRSRESAGALVAERDGVVIGFASYQSTSGFEPGRICQLTSLVVTEEHRRMGVGQAILEEVERRARDAGCSLLWLMSGRRPEREAAHRFYPALGFKDACSHHAFYAKEL